MYQNGDIYMADIPNKKGGSIQMGRRPVLIVSNDKANQFSTVITIVPLSSKTNKKYIPTQVYLKNCGLKMPSIALVEQITSITKDKLYIQIGNIRETEYESKVRTAMSIQLNMQVC